MSTAQSVLNALSSFGLKAEGQGRYRLNSPLRPGSNSHAFTLTIADDEHGSWYDHVSGESGSLYELARRMGIETLRASVSSTKRVYSGLADYAEAHGVDAADLERWMWRAVTYQKRPALEYPTHTGRRWRFLDGKEPRYISEKGYKPSLYGLSNAVIELVSDGYALVLCNGEISTIAGQAHNIPSVCVTSGEKESLPPDALDTLLSDVPGCSIVVAMDCDDTGRRCGSGIAAQLRAAGFNARAVDLGLSDGGDLADFCMLYGGDAPNHVLTCPELPRTADQKPAIEIETYGLPREKLLGAGDGWIMLYSDDLRYLPMVKWLLKPYIPEFGQVAIFGPSGTGKSFLALWFALQIAQQRNVLYMAYEGEFGYQARIRAAQNHYHFSRGVHLTLGQVDLMGDDEYLTFVDQARKINPSVVFIDTLAMSMVGMDENSQRDMGLYTSRCKRLARELGAAVVVVHHTNKGGTVERGSTALRGTMDVMIRLEEADDRVLVECAKTKDGKPFQSFYIRLHSVDTGLADEDGMPVFTPVAVIAHHDDVPDTLLTKHQRAILNQMILEIYVDDGMTPAQIKESCPQMSKGTLDGAISSLKTKGYIAQSAKREPYTITEAGRSALDGGKPWIPPTDTPQQTVKPAKQGALIPDTTSTYHKAGL